MRSTSASLLLTSLALALACGSPTAPPSSPGTPPAPDAPAQLGSAAPRPAPPDPPAAGAPALSLAEPPLLVVGTRQQLIAGPPTVRRTLSWKSNAPAIAAVDSSGGVHGIAPGTATIVATVKYSDGSTESASTSVTVRPNPAGDSGNSRRHRRH